MVQNIKYSTPTIIIAKKFLVRRYSSRLRWRVTPDMPTFSPSPSMPETRKCSSDCFGFNVLEEMKQMDANAFLYPNAQGDEIDVKSIEPTPTAEGSSQAKTLGESGISITKAMAEVCVILNSTTKSSAVNRKIWNYCEDARRVDSPASVALPFGVQCDFKRSINAQENEAESQILALKHRRSKDGDGFSVDRRYQFTISLLKPPKSCNLNSNRALLRKVIMAWGFGNFRGRKLGEPFAPFGFQVQRRAVLS